MEKAFQGIQNSQNGEFLKIKNSLDEFWEKQKNWQTVFPQEIMEIFSEKEKMLEECQKFARLKSPPKCRERFSPSSSVVQMIGVECAEDLNMAQSSEVENTFKIMDYRPK